jgi:thymidylate synthase ThyX
MPVSWGEEKRGMQAGEDVSQDTILRCKHKWLQARNRAVEYSRVISGQGVHKQVANRLLAPFLKIQVIVTATEWDNFFNLRCHPDADPTMRELADNMKHEYNNSIPVLRKFHIPFHDNSMASAGACARVSYLSEAKSKEEDMELAAKLIANKHLSPFEHQATAIVSNYKYDNFVGWQSFRNSHSSISRGSRSQLPHTGI